jgi:hypothetical protein
MAKAKKAPEQPGDASEYDAFDDLAKKLPKVPKKDLDEARKREGIVARERARQRSGSDD